YKTMLEKYIREREYIPKGNLVEVRYEEFISNPLTTLQTIYDTFSLQGYQDATPAFETYFCSQKNLRTDTYRLTDEVREKIQNNWGFALKTFGYEG
ncbi:MAG TPA: sulfotransferase, partial [Thermoplasmatales archaeon]|nr:sulfotransferase [Thermoplasmatales archaeon]